MVGWVLFVLTLVLFVVLKHKETKRRTNLADFVLLFFAAPESFEEHRNVFNLWLAKKTTAEDKRSLWLECNTAVERMAESWAARVPSSIGVAELLWETRENPPA